MYASSVIHTMRAVSSPCSQKGAPPVVSPSVNCEERNASGEGPRDTLESASSTYPAPARRSETKERDIVCRRARDPTTRIGRKWYVRCGRTTASRRRRGERPTLQPQNAHRASARLRRLSELSAAVNKFFMVNGDHSLLHGG